jgi:hypothetical protein
VWWTYVVVVALLALGVWGFVTLTRTVSDRLSSRTDRTAEDLYDAYADDPRRRHRRRR